MPLPFRRSCCGVLENGEVVRIGANDPIKVDVRIIAATNKDLQKEVEAGQFRQDLFFRLKVGTIRLPPLRERKEDIPQLGAHFLKEFAKRHGKPVPKVAAGGVEGVRGLRLAGQRPRAARTCSRAWSSWTSTAN